MKKILIIILYLTAFVLGEENLSVDKNEFIIDSNKIINNGENIDAVVSEYNIPLWQKFIAYPVVFLAVAIVTPIIWIVDYRAHKDYLKLHPENKAIASSAFAKEDGNVVTTK